MGTRESGVPWLRQVPESWTVKPLYALGREVKTLNKGLTESNLLSLSYGEIRRKDIDANFGLLPESFDSYQIVQPGDIVFRFTDLQNDQKSLRSGLVGERGIITNAYVGFRPKSIDSRYLNYLMRAYDLVGVFYSMGSGLRQSLKYSDVRRLPILVPPFDEQLRIVDHLDRERSEIRNLIDAQETLEELLESRKEASILQAVTGGLSAEPLQPSTSIPWLPRLPAGWKVSRTRFHCRISTGSGDTQDASLDGAFPFFVRSDRPRRSDTYEFDGDAVLTAGDGAVGKVYHLVSGKFMAHQRVYVLNSFKGVTPKFFYYFFSATFARVALEGGARTTVDSLRRPMLANHILLIPPMAEQDSITDILDEVVARHDELIRQCQLSLRLLRERERSLISFAVTGGLEVGYGSGAQ